MFVDMDVLMFMIVVGVSSGGGSQQLPLHQIVKEAYANRVRLTLANLAGFMRGACLRRLLPDPPPT